MNANDQAELHRKLHTAKTNILSQIQQALSQAGLGDVHIESLRLYLKHPAVQCPEGTEPEFEPESLADGSVVYRWVCKPRV
jgi:hypothetical protein